MRNPSLLALLSVFIAPTSLAFDDTSFNFNEQSSVYVTHHSKNISLNLTDKDTSVMKPDIQANTFIDDDLPKYLKTSQTEDWQYLKEQTYTILGMSVTAVGLMTFLPESITNWTAEDRDFSNLANKWLDNVKAGPVWDKDDHYLNYIMHPYFGGTYYTAARHAGFDQFDSFLYSFMMSTFFWEYGVESFAEVPSAQDLVITPLFGAAVGEWMYLGEQSILRNGGEVLGSTTLGDVSLFFLNPVGHIHYAVTSFWRDDAKVTFSYDPWMNNNEAKHFAISSGFTESAPFLGLQVELAF